jgi:hypothetical protein
MHRYRPSWPATVAGLGFILGVVALFLAIAAGGRAASPAGPFRAYAPMLAGDDAGPGLTPSSSTPSSTPMGGGCASSRVLVKTLADPGAASIDREPAAQSIPALRALLRPAISSDTSRIAPVETTVYSVNVLLASLRQTPDKELQLLVADPGSNATMVVSFPNRDCLSGASAADQAAMNVARVNLISACGNPPSSGSKLLQGTAAITGVGFFGQPGNEIDGGAPNGVELHPALSFVYKGAFPCNPLVTPVPTLTATPIPSFSMTLHLVPNPVQRGHTVQATLHTSSPVAPNVTCTIVYTEPQSGIISNDPALLVGQTTDFAGVATWTWTIPENSLLGNNGTVSVTCPGPNHTKSDHLEVIP